MTTTAKKNKPAKPAAIGKPLKKAQDKSKASVEQEQDEKIEYIPIARVDLSPLNHRKYYDPQALDKFAGQIKQYGIIHPLTLRLMASGRYEVVSGERRYRGAEIAGLQRLKSIVKELSDQQVIELQLVENLQREDPHPLHIAQGIVQLQTTGFSIDQIAARLGRTKAFVFQRIKLTALIEPFQQVFMAGKFTQSDAFEIAALAEESQQDLFQEHFKGWEKKEFRLYGLSNMIGKFRYDLKRAPFDTKDKNLVPEMGACSKCPFNTATLKTLFPEMAKEATCTNKPCYKQKCTVHLTSLFEQAVDLHQPVALLSANGFSDTLQQIIAAHPTAKDLPVHGRYSVSVFNSPSEPDKEDYAMYGEEEDGDFDEAAYSDALEEYQSELEEFNHLKEKGSMLIGLFVSESEIKPLLFSLDNSRGSKAVTSAKAVQEAIKNGTVTAELLEAEALRLQAREARAKEIDRDKVQLKVHEELLARCSVAQNNENLTTADLATARLIIFDSLDYHNRQAVETTLFDQHPDKDAGKWEDRYHLLASLTEQQFAYLIRMAAACKAESKMPNTYAGFALYKQAESAGVDVPQIEQAQQEKQKVREEKLTNRLTDVQKRLEKLKPVTAS